MIGTQEATVGSQTEANSEQLIPIAEMVELTGISERTLRDYRKGIENALQRRITKRVPHGKTFKLFFYPEATQMFEDWRNRYSDEEFVGKYASEDNGAIEAGEDVVEASIVDPEYGLTVYQESPLDSRLAQLMDITTIQPVSDVVIAKSDSQLEILTTHIVNTTHQEVMNEATEFNRERVTERQKGRVEGMILHQERRAGRAEAVQELRAQESVAKEKAQLQQRLAELEGGGNTAKATTKRTRSK